MLKNIFVGLSVFVFSLLVVVPAFAGVDRLNEGAHVVSSPSAQPGGWEEVRVEKAKTHINPTWEAVKDFGDEWIVTPLKEVGKTIGSLFGAGKDIVLTGAEATKQVAGLAGWLAWTLKWIVILLPWALLIGAGVAIYMGAFGAFAAVVGRGALAFGRGIAFVFSLFVRRGP